MNDEGMVEQLHKAKALFERSIRSLSEVGQEELAGTLDRFLPMVLPYLVEGRAKNPVHHTAHVVGFMVEILVGEHAQPQALKRGVTAALLHDIGLARTDEGKIRKSDLVASLQAAADAQEARAALDQAVQSRRSHMDRGAEIGCALLAVHNAWHGEFFSDADIAEIKRLIAIHDYPSIAEYGLAAAEAGAVAGSPDPRATARAWLFEREDWLAQCLRESDRLYMLTVDGIENDLARDRRKGAQAALKQGIPFSPSSVRAADRIQSNLVRHHEEAELSRWAHGPEAEAFGFRQGLLYRTATGFCIYRRLLHELESAYGVQETNVAASLGGTKLAVAIVGPQGVLEVTTPEVAWREHCSDADQPQDGPNADRLVAGIAGEIARGIRRARELGAVVTRIGLATKGPIRQEAGETIIGHCSTLPFHEYPLSAKLRAALQIRGVKLPLAIMHDGAAAALGEAACVRAQGAQPDLPHLAAVIIGTGIGVGIVEAGALCEGIGGNDEGPDALRNLGSLGRHLIRLPPDASGGVRYEYRGVSLGHDRPELAEDSAEMYFTERLAGPWLAVHLIDALRTAPQPPEADLRATLGRMGLSESELDAVPPRRDATRADLNCRAARTPEPLCRKVLVGLTAAALDGDGLARSLLAECGREIGAALGAFIGTFWALGHRFVQRLILVSAVGENLGRNVRSADGDDWLLVHAREAARAALIERGLDRELAESLARGIRRSGLDHQREFRAFRPGDDCLSAHP